VETKICSCCKEEKSTEEYWLKKSGKDGLNARCKICESLIKAEKYRINSEKIKKIANEYRKNNPEKVKKLKHRYYENNKEIIKKRSKKWLEDHPEMKTEKSRRYDSKYPERVKEKTSRMYKKHRVKLIEKAIKEGRKAREELKDTYIIKRIKADYNLATETIKNNPELIESKKLSIKIKRLLKHKKDENTEPS